MASPTQGYQPQRNVNLDVIGPAWALFMKDPGTWVLATLIVALIAGALGFLASITVGLGGIVVPVAYGVLAIGAYRMAFKQLRQQKFEIGDLFDFQDVLGPAVIAGLLVSLAVSVASVFCVLPGLVVAGLLMFALPLVADRKMEGIDAMKLSFETLKEEWLMAGVFQLVIGLIFFAGFLACGVGVFVAGPVALLAHALLYRAYFPDEAAASPAPQAQETPEAPQSPPPSA